MPEPATRSLLPSLLLCTAVLAGCSSTNPYFDASRAHYRPQGFANSDPGVVGGAFPWYEILGRRLRGDFQPSAPPAGGYAAFAERWQVPVDLKLLHERTAPPRIIWLGHASLLLQVGERNILIDPNFSDYAGPKRWL